MPCASTNTSSFYFSGPKLALLTLTPERYSLVISLLGITDSCNRLELAKCEYLDRVSPSSLMSFIYLREIFPSGPKELKILCSFVETSIFFRNAMFRNKGFIENR